MNHYARGFNPIIDSYLPGAQPAAQKHFNKGRTRTAPTEWTDGETAYIKANIRTMTRPALLRGLNKTCGRNRTKHYLTAKLIELFTKDGIREINASLWGNQGREVKHIETGRTFPTIRKACMEMGVNYNSELKKLQAGKSTTFVKVQL